MQIQHFYCLLISLSKMVFRYFKNLNLNLNKITHDFTIKESHKHIHKEEYYTKIFKDIHLFTFFLIEFSTEA